MHPFSTPLSTSLEYHNAWSSGDTVKAAELLSEDLLVEVPLNNYSGKPDFVAALTAFAAGARRVDMLATFQNRGGACLIYDMEVDRLGGLRVAEHFLIEDGRINTIRQIHDTAKLRRAGFGPELED